MKRYTYCTIFIIVALFIFPTQEITQSSGKPLKPLILPTSYEGHRFYVEPVTTDGRKFKFFTDTGGGDFIFNDAVERNNLPIEEHTAEGRKFKVVTLPSFKSDLSIPLPQGKNGRLRVSKESKQSADWWVGGEADGMLGQEWFGERVWTFDYPGRRLLLHASGDLPKYDSTHKVTLGFQVDEKGKRALDFPRIQVIIDSETLDLLFDTGATTSLSDSALKIMQDKDGVVRATSFITNSIFQKWQQRHPDWRVIEKAETTTGQSMIEVPSVTVAGYTVGPIWFTNKPDKSFHEFMTQFMDKKIEGALGGNALRFFQITVDYPNAIAIFKKK